MSAMALIQVPSKYDIIPIHTSDVGSYMRCRRYWDWTSPTRNNLRRKVQIHGINFPLFFGSGVHYALEMYYNPALQRDPVEAFKTWWTIQWEGGTVEKDWLDRIYDTKPVEVTNPGLPYNESQWKIRGLRDLHPNPDSEEFKEHYELGIGMLTFYRDVYAPKNDAFRVISAESTFSVPLGFEAIDVREESPNYGKLLEVHARGKRDAVCQWLENDKYFVLDHKTAAKIDEAYFLKLENDPQCSNYIWASEQEAKLYDLPYKDIDGIIYQGLRKVYPKPPTVLKNGTPSLGRTTESTTPELFQQYIADNNLQLWYDADVKAQSYYKYLIESGDSQFIVREYSTRNAHQKSQTEQNLRMVAEEMLDPKLSIYPNPSGNWLCVHCALRSPCLAKDDGSDWKDMIVNGYEGNLDR